MKPELHVDEKRCAICGKKHGRMISKQLYRPYSVFDGLQNNQGFIYIHPQCLLDYKAKMEGMR